MPNAKPTSNLRIPQWNTQGAPDSFPYSVKNINGFNLTAGFPSVADWEDAKLRSRLHDRLYDDVSKLLHSAEFFSVEHLEQKSGSDYFMVQYGDDIYDFQIACYKNRLVLQKHGVLLRTFHDWYHRAVPGVKTVFESLLSLMSEELGRNQGINSASYNFSFVAYDFSDGGKSLKNFQVLNRLITLVPGCTGEITAMSGNSKEISRLNYKTNVWDRDESGERRRLTYGVQAPSNRDYSGLWLDFAYGTETYTDPETGLRAAIDPVLLLDEYERIYSFLWQKALGGFMKSLLNRISFETTPTYIP